MDQPVDERRPPRRRAANDTMHGPPSRPVAPVTLYGDARSRYVEKCRDLRSWLETLAHDPSRDREKGVKRRLEAHFPGREGRWLSDLHHEMCEVAHNKWTSLGDPEWLVAAEAAARNNFVPPCCRSTANGRRPRNRRRG